MNVQIVHLLYQWSLIENWRLSLIKNGRAENVSVQLLHKFAHIRNNFVIIRQTLNWPF